MPDWKKDKEQRVLRLDTVGNPLSAVCLTLQAMLESVFPSPPSIFSTLVFISQSPKPYTLEILVTFQAHNTVTSFWRSSSFLRHLRKPAIVFFTSPTVLLQLPDSLKHTHTNHPLYNVEYIDNRTWMNHAHRICFSLLPRSNRNKERCWGRMKISFCHMWFKIFNLVLNLLLSKMAKKIRNRVCKVSRN